MSDEDKKSEFVLRHIVIPIEVLIDPNLTGTAKHVFSIVHMLDHHEKHCFASNEYIAALLNVSVTHVSKSLNLLIQEGYLESVSFDGRIRTVKIADDYLEKHSHLREYINFVTEFREKPSEIPIKTKTEEPRQNRLGSLALADKAEKNRENFNGQPCTSRQGSSELQFKHNNINDNNNKTTPKGVDTGPPGPVLIVRKPPVDLSEKFFVPVKRPTLLIKRKPVKVEPVKVEPVKVEPVKVESTPARKKRPPAIEEILNYWEGKGFYLHREGTKALAESVSYIKQAFDGTLFDSLAYKEKEYADWAGAKFTIDDFKLAIDCLEEVVNHVDQTIEGIPRKYLISNCRNNFRQFIFSAYSYYKSPFLHCLIHGLAKNRQPIYTDENPYITEKFEKFYTKLIGHNHLPPEEKNHLISVSATLMKFVNLNLDKLDYRLSRPIDLALDCADRIIANLNNYLGFGSKRELINRFNISWFISGTMLKNEFPNWKQLYHD